MKRFKVDDFGIVNVTFRRGMRSVTARWKNGELCINTGNSSTDDLIKFLNDNKERLLALHRPTVSYSNGMTITCFAHTVTLGTHTRNSNTFSFGGENEKLFVNVPSSRDFNDPAIVKVISSALKRLMKDRAAITLIPFAQSVAQELNLQPKRFVIGRGLRKLGHCTATKEIQLSYNLMFFPSELVRYIICHELAHLTEMNHSANFHKLCNQYCNGKEPTLNKQLKNFTLPTLR